jgi:Zn-dependent M28 family amino/carboxypeptidase
VVGLVPGSDPEKKDEHVVISANIDALGTLNGDVYCGADGNAGGTAAVLEIAEAVAANPPARSVFFVLFTGAENLMIGSRHFMEHCPVSRESIVADVHLNMLGRQHYYIEGFYTLGTSNLLTPLSVANDSLTQAELLFDTTEGYWQAVERSDQYSFHARGISSIMITAGRQPDHLTPQDTADKVDYDKLKTGAVLAYGTVMELADQEPASP